MGEIVDSALRLIKEWAAIGGLVAAFLMLFAGKGPVAAIGRWRDGVLKAVFYPFAGEQRAMARAEKTEKLVEAILVELKTNGGSSLKDAINRIEDRQVRMDGRVNLMLTGEGAVAAFETDDEGLCIWISPAHQRLTGRGLDEVKGRGWFSFIHDDDCERVREAWLSAVGGGWPFSTQFRIVRLDGVVIRVHSTANPLWAGPRVVGWSGLINIEDTP